LGINTLRIFITRPRSSLWYATGELIRMLRILLYNATNISRQVHDVPYRLLSDSSPKTQPKAIDIRQQQLRQDFDFRMAAQKDDDEDVLSKSAPHSSHPMQSDSEHSLSPRLSDDLTMKDVQRTISLTSENPSEAFFSADEDIHASRSSSLKTTDGTLPYSAPKKRFASDLSIVGPELGKLSSHRSDYEIHTPEHRSLPTRPQSTAELVSLLLPQQSMDLLVREFCLAEPKFINNFFFA